MSGEIDFPQLGNDLGTYQNASSQNVPRLGGVKLFPVANRK